MRIALADDDRDIREQVTGLVRKAGHIVDVNVLEDPKYYVADDAFA